MPGQRSEQGEKRHTSWWDKLWVIALMAAASVAMTWPLADKLDVALNDYGDPLLNSWILWWDLKALTTSGLSLFNAPIFHPAALTLAYSEHMLVSAFTAAPFLWAGVGPLTAHNLVFLISFFLAGFGGFLLGYELTGSRAAGVVAGLGFAFAPFRFGHLGHLQILTAQYMPFTLLFLHRWLKGFGWGAAVAFGLFWLLQILSCGYHALFISLAVGLFLLYYAWQAGWWRSRRAWLQLAVVFVVVGLVVAPLFLPYVRVKEQMGFVRSLDLAAGFSARPWSYLAAPPANDLYGRFTEALLVPEGQLFLGLALSALAILGLWGGWKGRRLADEPSLSLSRPVDAGFYLLMAFIAFWASLGPDYGLYILFYELVPGFDSLRVPARLAVLVTLAWAALGAMGMAWLQRRLKAGALLSVGLAVLAGGLILVEGASAPINWLTIYKHPPLVYRWLKDQPGDAVVYEIPTMGFNQDQSRDARYLFWSTHHEKTLVNGYSGFFPKDYVELAAKAPELPDPAVLDLLRARGVKYLILAPQGIPARRAGGGAGPVQAKPGVGLALSQHLGLCL